MSNEVERKAFEQTLNPHSRERNEVGDYVSAAARDAWAGWQARAAYQRTQAQPADAYRMARALSDRYADQCGVDRDDYWKLYGQDCIDDVRAMLEGAKHE